MIRRRTLGIGAALAFIGSAALLFSGHPLLDWPGSGLPLGTLIAGVFVASLGALPLAIAPVEGTSRRLAAAVFVLAMAWLPASLLMAGNWRLNFDGGPRSEWATALGMFTLAAIALGSVVAALSRIRAARTTRHQKSTDQ